MDHRRQLYELVAAPVLARIARRRANGFGAWSNYLRLNGSTMTESHGSDKRTVSEA